MGTEQSRRRFAFLRYSLRGMLLSMALIGVGLVVFRWPWVEREVFTDPLGHSETRLQTYRRDWKGQPIKHGISKFANSEQFFADGVLIWEAQYSPEGKLRFKHHYQNGQLHGPYYAQEGEIQGEYRRGLKEGKWRVTQLHDGELVQCERSFKANVPHGDWQWSSPGKVLQSATFDQGRLTRWNGREVADELTRVLAAKQVDSLTQEILGTRIEHVELDQSTCHGGTAFEWPLRNSYHRLVLQLPMMEKSGAVVSLRPAVNDPARPVAEAFLEQALLGSQTLDYRFGVICFVPIGSQTLRGQDPSGVSQIQFTPGSREEQAWLEPVSVSQDMWAAPAIRVKQLFAGTPIEVDAKAFPMQPAIPSRFPQPEMVSSYRRSRRDLLGLILLARGWTCQQKGNRLEIVPKGAG
jgi:hypothetical protein